GARRPRFAPLQERTAPVELPPPAQAAQWPVAETRCRAPETPAGCRLPSEAPVPARSRAGPREAPPQPPARRQAAPPALGQQAAPPDAGARGTRRAQTPEPAAPGAELL